MLTAQRQTIDGVEQALTSRDIVDNLQDRLKKIKKYQDDLNILRARGLSEAAYKQLVDAGIEGGGDYVAALLENNGDIQKVNSLIAQIDAQAKKLGKQASDTMYKAGVDTARGLVKGLESLQGRIDKAAERLGNKIADSIAKALGIKSPSRRAMAMMDDWGDGTVIGLQKQEGRVQKASQHLSDQVAVSPEVAAHAASQRANPYVSGNGPLTGRPGDGGAQVRDVDITVVTPTEDPKAVAKEVLNEITGRL